LLRTDIPGIFGLLNNYDPQQVKYMYISNTLLQLSYTAGGEAYSECVQTKLKLYTFFFTT